MNRLQSLRERWLIKIDKVKKDKGQFASKELTLTLLKELLEDSSRVIEENNFVEDLPKVLVYDGVEYRWECGISLAGDFYYMNYSNRYGDNILVTVGGLTFEDCLNKMRKEFGEKQLIKYAKNYE